MNEDFETAAQTSATRAGGERQLLVSLLCLRPSCILVGSVFSAFTAAFGWRNPPFSAFVQDSSPVTRAGRNPAANVEKPGFLP